MKDRSLTTVILIIAITLLCCLCVSVAAFVTVRGFLSTLRQYGIHAFPFDALEVPADQEKPEITPPAWIQNPNGSTQSTLELLQNTIIPPSDFIDLARRLEHLENIPDSLPPPLVPFEIGTTEEFWVRNTDTNENFLVTARLEYITEHLYFWIQQGVRFKRSDLERLANTFEDQIYPTNRAFFGSEWTPGIDSDPHVYVLYARDLGESIAGYFSSSDEIHPLAFEFSNAHEMFFLNADTITLGEIYTYGTLTHEFQHMIHWFQDRNEESWVNEGFSELAAFLNNYYTSGFDSIYVSNPDIQLTDWPDDDAATYYHYGGAFLFMNYFLGRFGEGVTQTLVHHPANGLESIDIVLEEIGAQDSTSGEDIRADDVFLDWVIATYLHDSNLADDRFSYALYPDAPTALWTETIFRCPQNEPITRDVHQYGVDYIRITCDGEHVLSFEGETWIPLLPTNFHSGEHVFWSNKGDDSNMTLTRTFDLRDHTGSVTLNYWTWYDLEENYDYVYLEASTDGEEWQILITPSGTAEDPSGNSFGWAYNATSGNGPMWIQESVDLTRFAGQEVHIRFEYVTDATVFGEGFLVDDIAVPEIDYFCDFETDSGGWVPDGFVRIDNALPQNYRLAIISLGEETTVEFLDLPPDNRIAVTLNIGGEIKEVVMVVTATTRFTRQTATYQISVTE